MKINIEPYSDLWPEQFSAYQSLIASALGDKAPAIEHIGSTSVIGLSAKPVIDIMVGVENAEVLEKIEPGLIDIGFTYIKSEKHIKSFRRTFFVYQHPENISAPDILNVAERDISHKGFIEKAHVHCWIWNKPDWIRHLAFRDYLRSHNDAKNEYQKMKVELAQLEWDSSLAYSQAKNDFIKGIENKTLDWYKNHHTR